MAGETGHFIAAHCLLDCDATVGTGHCVFADVFFAGELVLLVLLVGFEEFEEDFFAVH